MLPGGDFEQPETTPQNVHLRAGFTHVRQVDADSVTLEVKTRKLILDPRRGQQHIPRTINHAQEAMALRIRL